MQQKKLVTFVKKETVLCIAGLLAVVSMFIIHPSADYFGYIDYRVLALLFCFMAVVAGFRSVGLFEMAYQKNAVLCKKCKTTGAGVGTLAAFCQYVDYK
mgnify:CR=1 FL=1